MAIIETCTALLGFLAIISLLSPEPTALSAVKIASRAVRQVCVVFRIFISVLGLDSCIIFALSLLHTLIG